MDSMARTPCSTGGSPVWEEMVQIPFVLPHASFSPDALSQIREDVHFALFDAETVPGEGGRRGKPQPRFLGHFSIPFSTIYMQGRVAGTFRVEMPPVNLGYTMRRQPNHRGGGGGGRGGDSDAAAHAEPGTTQNFEVTTLTVQATLEPPLKRPVQGSAPEDTDAALGEGAPRDERKLYEYGLVWLAELQDTWSGVFGFADDDRHFMVYAPDYEGKQVFIPRYLMPQEPPPGMTTHQHCCRFVSLVPFLEDWQVRWQRALALSPHESHCPMHCYDGRFPTCSHCTCCTVPLLHC